MSFEAKYHSRCPACDGHIGPGDDVRWAEGEVLHGDCDAVEAGAGHPAPPLCPRCFMVPSLTGVCGCDD